MDTGGSGHGREDAVQNGQAHVSAAMLKTSFYRMGNAESVVNSTEWQIVCISLRKRRWLLRRSQFIGLSERKNRLLEMKVRPAMRAPQYHATLVTLSNPLECKEVSLAVPFVPFDKLGDLPCNRRC